MADTVDVAQEYTRVYEDLAVIQHYSRPKEQAPAHFDGVHCSDCDEPIPPKRIELTGSHRCVDCQGAAERK